MRTPDEDHTFGIDSTGRVIRVDAFWLDDTA
jgi:hypothetical protein